MAQRCLQLALAANPDHAESLCNLGIIYMRSGYLDRARNLFTNAGNKAPHMFEPFFNLALLNYQVTYYIKKDVNIVKTLLNYFAYKWLSLLGCFLLREYGKLKEGYGDIPNLRSWREIDEQIKRFFND